MTASRDERRASHPEIDWRHPITLMNTNDETIHPRSTGRNYANSVARPLCICGCTTDAHDLDTGECRVCGCEWLQAVSS